MFTQHEAISSKFVISKSPPFVLPELAEGGIRWHRINNKNHLILFLKLVNLHPQKVRKEYFKR